MAMRDQHRAALAYAHVDSIERDTPQAKKYATIVHKMPTLIQTAGLCQALHYVSSRNNNEMATSYLNHLAEQLGNFEGARLNQEGLLQRVRTATLRDYLRLTDEAMACATWYRRMVQGVLKIEHADADQEAEA